MPNCSREKLISCALFLDGIACVSNGSSWSNTIINCTIGRVPAGTHIVVVLVEGNGYAWTSPIDSIRFQSILQVSRINNSLSGFGGGVVLTVSVGTDSQLRGQHEFACPHY
jgi:hypothetical protein